MEQEHLEKVQKGLPDQIRNWKLLVYRYIPHKCQPDKRPLLGGI